MRVQIVPMTVPSHIALVVPIAWALRNAGHEVRVMVPPNMTSYVTGAGLVAIPYGMPIDLGTFDLENINNSMSWMATVNGMDSDGSEADEELRNLILSPLVMYYGAEIMRPTLDDLVDKTVAWQPDLVLWDSIAGYAVALPKISGAASARLLWGFDHMARMRTAFLSRTDDVRDSVAAVVGAVLARYDLEYDESMLLGDFTVNPVPILGQSSLSLPTVALRQPAYANPADVPEWVLEPPSRPRVCITLGRSVRDLGRDGDNYGISVGALFEAVASLEVEVVATFTAAQLAEDVKVPDNVRLVEYVPFSELIPTCAAIVHHSGGTTMMAAMWHAVPQVIVSPRSWGDPDLTRLTVEHGAGLSIPADELTAEDLRAALMRVLEDPSFARGAASMRSATQSLPNPNEAVPVIERLTRAVHFSM